ncbi:hypothetical protein J7E51_27855 [Priestia megaterium]|nr:hypothetical protein [Priestia megaterium]
MTAKYKSAKEAGKVRCFLTGSLIFILILIGITIVVGLGFCFQWIVLDGIPFLFKNYKWLTLTFLGSILFIFISLWIGNVYYDEPESEN